MKKINKILFYILSFIFPIIIIVFCNIVKGNSFSKILNLPDVDFQYIPLLKYLKSCFSFNNNILYSFSKSLGGSMYATYFYYLSSPINIICIFFKNIYFEIFNYLFFIKVGLSGLTMFIFFNCKSKYYLYNFVFSMCYSLMGFNIVFENNYMWFDVVYMVPIVCLGIDLLIKNKDCRLYIISLSYAIWCNFYIAFSLCIFSFIYFFYSILIIKNKKILIKRFILYSLLIGGLCAFFLIPIFFELFSLKGRFILNNFFTDDYNNFPLFIYKILIGSNSLKTYSIMNMDAPNIYCSIFVFLFDLLYLFCYSVSKKEKIIVISIELFFILSIIIQPLYMMWHCFSMTNGNPFRFSFLWCFFNIYIAFKCLLKIIDDAKFYYKNFFLVFILFLILLIILYFSSIYSFFYNGLEFMLSFLFFILYIFLIKYNKIFYCIFLIIIELTLNCYITIDYSDLYNNNFDNRNKLCDIVDSLDSMNNRINSFGLNNSLFCGYSSLSGYYSTFSNALFDFVDKFGIKIKKNLMIDDSFNSEIFESILGIDYYVDGDYNLFKNNNVLSIGYMIKYNKVEFDESYISNLERFLNSMIGQNYNYFIEYDLYSHNKKNYYFYYGNSNEKYLFIDSFFNNTYVLNLKVNNISQIIDDMGYLIFPYSFVRIRDKSNIVYLDLFIYSDDNNNDNNKLPFLNLYELNYDNFNMAINILKEQELNITKIKKNKLEGNIEVKKNNQYLFLSIPYEKGWHIYVDGKKTNYEKLYNAFIGIKLNKGYHEIKMVFYPQGLNFGIIISSFSLILAIIFIKKK